jgi:hypothetical protein
MKTVFDIWLGFCSSVFGKRCFLIVDMLVWYLLQVFGLFLYNRNIFRVCTISNYLEAITRLAGSINMINLPAFCAIPR